MVPASRSPSLLAISPVSICSSAIVRASPRLDVAWGSRLRGGRQVSLAVCVGVYPNAFCQDFAALARA
eukprot:6004817-Lingulodinium_polyedra.AAC.1